MDISKLLQSLKSKPNPHKQGSSGALSFDLLYQLSYMSVIAAAGVPRNQIFESAARTRCASSEYFRKVQTACERLKYDYAKACRLVGESADQEEIRSLLLRMSSSLVSGEPEAEFLAREAESQAETYYNEYGRKLETLKLWTDAYVSLILSAVLVIIVGVVSTMIWKIQTLLILGMTMVAVCTTLLGIWLIYLMCPREFVVLGHAGSREQKLVRRLTRLILPAGVMACAIMVPFKLNAGWALLAAAAFAFPVGLISTIDDRKVTKRDSEVGAFLRSLGGVCAAVGTTVKDGLARLDLDAINMLRRDAKRLHVRLASGIRAKLCWDRFVDETGSELANRSVGMFYDAIDLGGEPGKAGYQASLYASRIAMLRARRKTVSFPFSWLCVAMHASVVVLLVFITEVITTFGTMVTKATEAMPRVGGSPSVGAFTSFNLGGLEMMRAMVLPLVIVFTVANAAAPSIADGGSAYKMLFTLAITAAISGSALIVLPGLAHTIFSGVAW